MTKVKICGITNLEDALAAVSYGADGMGFVFYDKSPRYIDPEKAVEIISLLPPFITTFGLFVNEDKERIKKIVNSTGVDRIQLHGDESPDFCREFSARSIKVIRVKGIDSIKEMDHYSVRGFLLDKFDEKYYGGTGISFDWDISIEAKKYGKIILAGGLNIDNVKMAIDKVRPYGVDVSSGVEKEKGIKDHNKLKSFIDIVKGRS